MSFWGMSAAGKDAQSKIGVGAGQGYDQYGNWAGNSANNYQWAQNMRPDILEAYQNLYRNGFASPDQIRQFGQQALPEVQDTINRDWGRYNDTRAAYGNVPGAEDVYGRRMENLDAAGQEIGNRWNDVQGDIGDTANRAFGRNEAANAAILQNVRDTAGHSREANDNEYGALRSRGGAMYDTLADTAGKWYGGMRDRTARQLDYNNATAARSFSPARAGELRRMRAAGVDPNSAEGSSRMASVDAARGRAFDDNFSNNTDRINALWGRQFDIGSELGQNKIRNDQALGTAQLNNELGITSNEGAQTRGENVRSLNTGNAIDVNRSNAAIGNRNLAAGQTMDWYGQRANEESNRRGMGIEDANIQRGLNQEGSALDSQHLGWLNNQYNTGMGWAGADLNTRMAGLTGQNAMMNQQYGQGNTGAGIAQNWLFPSMNAYNSIYNNESQNAGWGAKGLMGMGSSLLSNPALKFLSDRRLKRNLQRVGTVLGSVPVYAFSYLWGRIRYVGVMAQDLVRVLPEAVHVGGENPFTDPWTVNYTILAEAVGA